MTETMTTDAEETTTETHDDGTGTNLEAIKEQVKKDLSNQLELIPVESHTEQPEPEEHDTDADAEQARSDDTTDQIKQFKAKIRAGKEQISLQKKQLDSYRDAIEARLAADLKNLSQGDQDLIAELGGEEPLNRLIVFSKLKSLGKVGDSHQPVAGTDQHRASATEIKKGKPTTLYEARKRSAEALRRVK